MKLIASLMSAMLTTNNRDPSAYLASSDVIDVDHPKIREMADNLASEDKMETIRRSFEFVRDEVRHSFDHQANPVTCKASDVVTHLTGYCYAKSHLLAALLRANDIPTGLCYQRLTIADDGSGPPYCLHGLNAVYLEDADGGDSYWYRIDPRGLKPGVQVADFTPPSEALAFPIQTPGEADFPEIYVDPLPMIVDALESAETWDEIAKNLPDIDLLTAH